MALMPVIADVPRLEDRWRPPIVKTIASEGQGLDELISAIAEHRAYLTQHPEGRQRARVRAAIELETILRETLLSQLLNSIGSAQLERMLDHIVAHEVDPYSAADALSPKNDTQRSLKSRIEQAISGMSQTRLLMFADGDTPVLTPWP